MTSPALVAVGTEAHMDTGRESGAVPQLVLAMSEVSE